ncbi:uncharacterized protein SRS1_14941 [Sporisorium reilianum f. sp. reilianum]|uniref:Uncharacterized protein n=1 Tax=Sporisorium reilianum f. sp. reilianum TaxID=72559 RepID=A0A2N8UHV8_9BASI|nr:uncharacterized protein SRS1_14941 [Sporisorium reilianum f. sp. reilianum]
MLVRFTTFALFSGLVCIALAFTASAAPAGRPPPNDPEFVDTGLSLGGIYSSYRSFPSDADSSNRRNSPPASSFSREPSLDLRLGLPERDRELPNRPQVHSFPGILQPSASISTGKRPAPDQSASTEEREALLKKLGKDWDEHFEKSDAWPKRALGTARYNSILATIKTRSKSAFQMRQEYGDLIGLTMPSGKQLWSFQDYLDWEKKTPDNFRTIQGNAIARSQDIQDEIQGIKLQVEYIERSLGEYVRKFKP